MTMKTSPAASQKNSPIQIKISASTKAILNRAAALRGQKLSEFILESARTRAEEIILDQRLFALDDKALTCAVAARRSRSPCEKKVLTGRGKASRCHSQKRISSPLARKT